MQVKITTDKDFANALDALVKKYGEGFEYLNGLHPDQLDQVEFIKNFCGKDTVADATIDANANVRQKDICTMRAEKDKPLDKLISLNKIFMEMKKKYGLEAARKWLEDEWTGAFYLHDSSSSSQVSYCFAASLDRLVEEGLFWVDGYNNQPPKHFSTFLDDVIEYVSFMANHSSGACGLPDILIHGYYFWKNDVKTGYYIKDPEYYARQSFQKLIYRLNQPYLRICQTAFTNVSIFDRPYLEALFGGKVYPDGSFVIDQIEEIIKFQKMFMEVISEIREQSMFTYPVLTYSLLFRDERFVDEEFAKWCSDHNTKWNDANFFMSGDVSTLSNCPLAGNTELKVAASKTSEVFVATIKDTYEWGPKEFYVVTPTGRAKAKINRFTQPVNHRIHLENGLTLETTETHLNPTKDGIHIPTSHLAVGDELPVATAKGVVYIPIVKIEKIKDYATEAYCVEVLEDVEPIFTLANGIITHNCRLLSNTSKLDAFINSIGGTALSVGSVKVNTINLMKIAYEAKGSETKYFEILRERAFLCCQVLDRIRHIIKRNAEKGLLPNICKGGIELEKCYCTMGCLGMFEAVEAFGYTYKDQFGNVYYKQEGIEFASKIFAVMNDVKDSFTKEYSFNIESVPRMSGDEA